MVMNGKVKLTSVVPNFLFSVTIIMKSTVKYSWMYIITVFAVLVNKSFAVKCKDLDKINRKKCFCINGVDTVDIEIQCPSMSENKFNIEISKNNIHFLCTETDLPYINLNLLPKLNISETNEILIEFCALNSSFTDLLGTYFNARNITSLVFDSIDELPLNLTKKSFQDLNFIKKLKISYTQLNIMDQDFLASTPNLLSLSLNRNSMRNFGKFFDSAPNLKVLELFENQIQHLPDAVFEKLNHLKYLGLSINNITSISRNSFQGLTNLSVLELASNNIQDIPEDSFYDMKNLTILKLGRNRIRNLKKNIFVNNMLLSNISLEDNRLELIENEIFHTLSNLESIKLSVNNIHYIPEGIFKNCLKLRTIELAQNNITTLPDDLFTNLTDLKVLNFNFNHLIHLPDKLFSNLYNLQVLSLNNNKLTTISRSIFQDLWKLEELHIRNNLLNLIDLFSFKSLNRLKYLDLSYNFWNNTYNHVADESWNALNPLTQIEKLILRNNVLNEIPYLPASLQLKYMDLSNNKINYLQIQSLISTGVPCTIDLTNNQIKIVDFTLAEISALFDSEENKALNEEIDDGIFESPETKLKKSPTKIKLYKNPISCDCRNFDLIRYNNNEGNMNRLKHYIDIIEDGLLCAENNSTSVLDLKVQDVTCTVSDSCPGSCRCSFSPYSKALNVNCSNSNMTSYPVFEFASQFKDNNSTMNANFIFNQTYLIMHDNKLTSGPNGTQIFYNNITKLDLSNNLITDLNWVPQSILELNLNNNQLNSLNDNFIRSLRNRSSLQRLKFKGNFWDCTCKSKYFQEFLIDFHTKINSSEIICMDQQNKILVNVELCATSPYLYIHLPIFFIIIICFLIACTLYYRYQTEIKIFLFAKNLCLWFINEEELDKDKPYDAFISYAHEDQEIVIENLLAELESGDNPYKVCIHTRDWIPGKFIPEQIENSVRDSRRTIIVLSNNFMNSYWAKKEFRAAHVQAMSEGRASLIVVILGTLDENKLNDDGMKELNTYLKTNTYVEWGDKYFWRKLKYALPHHAKGGFVEANNRKHANVMLKIDEKFSNNSTPPITLDASNLTKNCNHVIDDIALRKKILEGESPLLV